MITMTENEVLKNLEDELSILKRLIKSGENVINIPHANKDARDYASENAKILLRYYIKRKEVYEIVISAIKEAQQYREIGTVEECREAREKQKAKKPKLNYKPKFFGQATYTCPKCGNVCLEKFANERQNNRYCWDCGQAIDWSGNLEGTE